MADPQNMIRNFQKALSTISPGLSIELEACSMMVLWGGGEEERERERGRERDRGSERQEMVTTDLVMTMATASLRTLSPNTSMFRVGFTSRAWNRARVATGSTADIRAPKVKLGGREEE